MKFAFRADASLRIGTGHVARCTTLARALQDRGHEILVVTRALPGAPIADLSAEFRTVALAPEPGLETAEPWHVSSWERDADASRAAVDGPPDWWIVDHYGLDARWEGRVLREGTRLLVIDDLANRVHRAHALLDANLGRRSVDYDAWVGPGVERLVGPRYALLRPEFERARESALARRGLGPDQVASEPSALAHLLIFLGGGDVSEATLRVLEALGPRASLLGEVTVVVGARCPQVPLLRARAESLGVPARVLVGVSDMAAQMAEADLAIGAAGGAAWERACVGLPTVLVRLADNQREGARALEARGAASVVGAPEEAGFDDRLRSSLEALALDRAARTRMAGSAAALVDGRGTARVVRVLEAPLSLRRARREDDVLVWQWRAASPPHALAGGPNPPLEDHRAWFARALESPSRRLWMADDATGRAIAHLRLDLDAARTARVSVVVAPESRGSGHGARLLSLLSDRARAEGIDRLIADIHADNAASRAIFLAAGYLETSGPPPSPGFARFVARPDDNERSELG